MVSYDDMDERLSALEGMLDVSLRLITIEKKLDFLSGLVGSIRGTRTPSSVPTSNINGEYNKHGNYRPAYK
jgi:hypothetical protein